MNNRDDLSIMELELIIDTLYTFNNSRWCSVRFIHALGHILSSCTGGEDIQTWINSLRQEVINRGKNK